MSKPTLEDSGFQQDWSKVFTKVVDGRLTRCILAEIQRKCNWREPDYKKFAPASAVSLKDSYLPYLVRGRYVAHLKVEGIRYLMYIKDSKQVYVLDRSLTVFQMNDDYKMPETLTDTLLDGDIIIKTFVTEPHVEGDPLMFYICDLVCYKGRDVGQSEYYTERTRIAREQLLPQLKNQGNGSLPFHVNVHEIHRVTAGQPLKCLNMIGTGEVSQLDFKPKGVIFNPDEKYYKAGTVCNRELAVGKVHKIKWEGEQSLTIDFLLQINNNPTHGTLLVCQRDARVPFHPKQHIKLDDGLRKLDGKIITCKYEDDEFVFVKQRTDRSHPNGFAAHEIFELMKRPVTKDMIIKYIKEAGGAAGGGGQDHIVEYLLQDLGRHRVR